jgi:hypothetical protein
MVVAYSVGRSWCGANIVGKEKGMKKRRRSEEKVWAEKVIIVAESGVTA